MLILLGAMLFGGFLLTSIISYLVSRNSIRNSILQEELPLSSNNIYSEIQRDLFEPILISSLMANDTFVKDWLLHGEKDEGAIVRYLAHIQEKYHTITSFLVSENTRNYYHSDRILKVVKEDNPADAWFFRVRAMKESYEINVDPDMANKDAMTIFINYRLVDHDGRFLGATGVGLGVNSVKALMEEYRTRYHRDVYFYDRNGKLVLHSLGEANEEDFSNHNAEVAMRSILDRIKAGETNITASAVGKNGAMAHYRYIPELDWILVVEQASDGTTPILYQSFAINLLVCLLTAIVLLSLIRKTVLRYQRHLEATNRQLTENKRQLRDANLAREKLFSVIGHDLRGPVGSLISFLDLMNEGALSAEEARQLQGDLRKGVNHVYVTLENLMQWGSFQTDPLKPRIESVNMRETSLEAAELLGLIAKEKKITVENTIPDTAIVKADAYQIQSVMRNLLSNALKFTPENGRVVLSAMKEKTSWRVDVQDSGIGMNEAQTKRLFETESEYISTLGTADERGLGLGLQLCLTFIEANGGTLTVKSSPGIGSTFSFVLPSWQDAPRSESSS